MPESIHALCVDRHPESDRALLDASGSSWTFGDIKEASARLAAHLRHAEGVERGDRVGIILPQRVEAALLHVACSRLGAIGVPLSPLFGVEGLHTRLADASPRVVFTTSDHLAMARDATSAPARDVAELPRDEAPLPAREQASPGPEDPAFLIYTSGTTGWPKGALLPHRVIAGRIPGFNLAHDGLDPEHHLFYSPADWSWIGGLHDSLLAPWHEGCAVLAHERHGQFDPAECYRLLVDHDVTDAFFPPTALKALGRAIDEPPVRLRVVHSAGEPLAQPVADWTRRHLTAALTEVYGLTEAAFLVGTNAEEIIEGGMGRAYPGHLVELADDEITVKRGDPTMMLGYWQGEGKAPDLPLDGENRFHTGDLAELLNDGIFRYLGRKDDLIKTSGYRVGPAEVEAALLHHPAVAECAVVGVPDAQRGQRVKAFVKLAPRTAPTPALAAQLQAFVKSRLAAHAYPRDVEFVDSLPMTTSGKIRRAELRRG